MTQPSRIDGLPDLPKPPEPYTVASTIKCTSCGGPYEPMRALAPMAAGGAFNLSMCRQSSACKCGSNDFLATVGYDSPSPVQFTANQVFDYATDYGRACYEAGSAAAAQAAKQVPEGWVPCTITYAEGEDPEEVAFGPQRMMDRLKKWLDSYFAKVYAERYPVASLAEAAEAGRVERQLLREALETIDTLPGYPKGADLCDRIEAFLAATPASPQAPCAEQCWACAESGIGCNLVNDCAQAPAPQAVVGEASEDPYFGVQDEVCLTRAVCVMNDVLTDISGWEDQALAEAVKSSKVDLCAMIECIRMRADDSYVPGTKPIDGEVCTPSPAPSAAPHQGADALREAAKLLVSIADPCSMCTGTEYKRRATQALEFIRAALAQHQAPQQGEQQ